VIADIEVTADLVRALLKQQHPDFADLPIGNATEGWDNYLFRLGDDLAVRLPRREMTAPMLEREQRWLPQLAAALPLPVPAPVRRGAPAPEFPWPWSIVPWLPGQSAAVVQPADWEEAATTIGAFVRALHAPAPADAPLNRWRSVPLADRAGRFREHLDALDCRVDRERALDAWDYVLAAGPWGGPALWIHGDLHPGNILIDHGRVSAVVDFGDLTAGDPATDLALVWMWFPAHARRQAMQAIDGTAARYGAATWIRARGWALAIGVAMMALDPGHSRVTAIMEQTVVGILDL